MDLHTILVATDFSDCSGAALQTAVSLGRGSRVKIVLLHVINTKRVTTLAEYLHQPQEEIVSALRERAQEQMARFLRRFAPKGAEVETMVAVGLPFQEIAVIARELAVDLIAIGGYGPAGRGPIEEVFFGSTAEKVVRLLPCPVLCVPLEDKSGTPSTEGGD